MDLNFTPEEEAFRAEVQAFLKEKLPQVVADVGARHLEFARRLAQVARVNDVHQQGQMALVQVHMSNFI